MIVSFLTICCPYFIKKQLDSLPAILYFDDLAAGSTLGLLLQCMEVLEVYRLLILLEVKKNITCNTSLLFEEYFVCATVSIACWNAALCVCVCRSTMRPGTCRLMLFWTWPH